MTMCCLFFLIPEGWTQDCIVKQCYSLQDFINFISEMMIFLASGAWDSRKREMIVMVKRHPGELHSIFPSAKEFLFITNQIS